MMEEFWKTPCRGQLAQFYLSQTPLKDIPWKEILCLNSVQDQEIFLHSTVCHKMCKKFPPKAEYKRRFLKKVIGALEAKNAEIYEDLYNLYVESLDSSKVHSSFSYKSYYLFNADEFIPLLECSSFLSCGTTGLNTWPGARILADWCVHNSDLFNNKKIIELGAGIGLTGVMVTKACLPASYLLTDYHDKVLKVLSYNVKLNFDDSTVICNDGHALFNEPLLLPAKCSHGDTVISIDSIDWTNRCDVDMIMQKYGGFDVILAADVVFEPSLLASLVNTIYRIMNQSCLSKQLCTGYFSVVVRNNDTFKKFYAELNSKGFEVIELEINLPSQFRPIYKQDTDIKLLKVVISASA